MAFLDTLRCPDCHARLVYERHEQPSVPGEYGVLSCPCFDYPVIDSVPVVSKAPVGVLEHVTSKVDFVGPDPTALVALIRAGKGGEALLRCIAFPAIPPRLLQMMMRRKPWPFRRLGVLTNAVADAIVSSPAYKRAAAAIRRATMRRRLHDRFSAFTTEDWFDLFYRRSAITGDFYPYYLFRHSQPRHLVAISLLNVLPALERPILDVACGFGHLTQHLNECCSPAHPAVGLDRLFFQAWVAKHWMAPSAQFVVADADRDLPFIDGAFGAVLCSDAFSLFRNRAEVLLEFERCAPGGPLVLTRVGNALVDPFEGQEVSPDEYVGLLEGRSLWISGEAELLRRYLERRAPDLSSSRDARTQNSEKWISIVVSNDPLLRKDHGVLRVWPHAAGQLALNPIYAAEGLPDGSLRLKFQFPSNWYAFQQQLMPSYHVDELVLSPKVCEQLERGERPDGADELIQKFVLVELPSRYTNGWKGSRQRMKPTGPVMAYRPPPD